MIRKLLVLFGVVEMITPEPIIDAYERLGLENPEAARLRPRANLLARLEGAMVVGLLVRSRERSSIANPLLGAAGVLAILDPLPLIRLSQSFTYENVSELELRPWVTPAARLLGVLCLAVVFLSDSEANSERAT